MGDDPANLIAKTSEATAQAVARALSGLRLCPTPTVRLSKFYGHPSKPGDLTVVEWLDEVEIYNRQMGITGAERVTSILDNVLSSAKEELLCAPDNVKGDYEEVVKLLKRRFGPAETLQTLTRSFNERMRRDTESLSDYSRALMRLYGRMEKAAKSQDEQAALKQLKDISLKGQFGKGAGSDAVLRDIERIEIRDPNITFTDLREEILRLYQNQEPKRAGTKVRSIEYTDDLSGQMSVSANSVPVSLPVDPNVQVLMETQKATKVRLDKLMDIMLKQASGQFSSGPTSGQPGSGQARGSSDSSVGQQCNRRI